MLTLRPFTSDDTAAWQKLVANSSAGTLFHDLDFLAYHGDRFAEATHHLMWYNGGALFGLMPLGIFEEDGRKIAKSPYGASYGGLVFDNRLNYSKAAECVDLFVTYLNEQGIDECRITPPIRCCSANPCDTVLFAFLEKGFKITNSDISNVVALEGADLWGNIHSKSRNMVRKAEKLGVEVRFRQSAADFWQLMDATFSRHGVSPTHSLEEWEWLCNKFPDKVWADIAYLDETPIAGVGHFVINERVDSSFYLARHPDFHHTQGMYLLISEVLKNSQQLGYKSFDFGTSSVNMEARGNIFLFKERFGAHGEFRHTLTWQKN
ncbi:MAG: GNAT family N-acetyltransferase [Calditrichia bacterium]